MAILALVALLIGGALVGMDGGSDAEKETGETDLDDDSTDESTEETTGDDDTGTGGTDDGGTGSVDTDGGATETEMLAPSDQPSAYEQELLELTNRARMDPQAEFDALIADALALEGVQDNITSSLQFFDVDLDVFAKQLAGESPAQPLAWNEDLASAAEKHSEFMRDADTQSHQLPGELPLLERVMEEGYDLTRIAENVFAYAEDPTYAHAAFYVDWGFTDSGIQEGYGHRVNILNPHFNEAGFGTVLDDDPATEVGPVVLTQNFGLRFDTDTFLLGVVFDDKDGDEFYDAGEGLSDVDITVSGGAETTSISNWLHGGYQLALDPGTYDVTFTDAALGSYTTQVDIGDENVKIDVQADMFAMAVA